ncbi:hypothetical protein [Clostridium omnivorum]|uniref:DUF8042 domain-containing protein n=1 Tax=Clostridium omnivorum TaxID=1604902 RepID=A0ABQ5NB72_9CLOT|nr:hypothetical protein [Clostridium sp. E14]GLC32334.1 hypothetical protein bsdE14_37440 [Clostridium sp. E14]
MDKEKQEALVTASEYIVNLKLGLKKTAEFFQNYDETKGSALLYKVIDGLYWIMDVLVYTKIVSDEEVVEINDNFKKVVNAFENEDYVLIGDLLFYEVMPIMDNIEIKINKCI